MYFSETETEMRKKDKTLLIKKFMYALSLSQLRCSARAQFIPKTKKIYLFIPKYYYNKLFRLMFLLDLYLFLIENNYNVIIKI